MYGLWTYLRVRLCWCLLEYSRERRVGMDGLCVRVGGLCVHLWIGQTLPARSTTSWCVTSRSSSASATREWLLTRNAVAPRRPRLRSAHTSAHLMPACHMSAHHMPACHTSARLMSAHHMPACHHMSARMSVTRSHCPRAATPPFPPSLPDNVA